MRHFTRASAMKMCPDPQNPGECYGLITALEGKVSKEIALRLRLQAHSTVVMRQAQNTLKGATIRNMHKDTFLSVLP
jgi:hypothetical protein